MTAPASQLARRLLVSADELSGKVSAGSQCCRKIIGAFLITVYEERHSMYGSTSGSLSCFLLALLSPTYPAAKTRCCACAYRYAHRYRRNPVSGEDTLSRTRSHMRGSLPLANQKPETKGRCQLARSAFDRQDAQTNSCAAHPRVHTTSESAWEPKRRGVLLMRLVIVRPSLYLFRMRVVPAFRSIGRGRSVLASRCGCC